MTGALHQLPSEALALRHVPSPGGIVELPVRRSPDPENWVAGNGEQPSRPIFFPGIGTFWRGDEGLALVEHVSLGGVVDFRLAGELLTRPVAEFYRRFPARVRI